MRRTSLFLFLAGSLVAAPATGQVRLKDLVVTGGVAAEGYRGNFSAITVAQVDSTESAAAGVGEFGVRGTLLLLQQERRSLALQFDGGLRQFAAGGFQLRDYSPREYTGNMELAYVQRLGRGSLTTSTTLKARGVADRPPMPLYLQPGYDAYGGTARYTSGALGDVRFDVAVTGEVSDYAAPAILPQLDLLDRSSVGLEVGASSVGASSLRLFGAYRHYSYPQQGSGVAANPFRTDNAFRAGAFWTLDHRSERGLFAQIGVDGTLNRSNSRRVEYDALRFNALASTALGSNYQIMLYGVLTAKRYAFPSIDALVPGEEADNASVAYAQLTRVLAPNLHGSFRLGWTRAETNIGGAYFRRFGASFFLNFRPAL